MRTICCIGLGLLWGCNGNPVPTYALQGSYRLDPEERALVDCDADGILSEASIVLTGRFPGLNEAPEPGTLTFLDQTATMRIDAPTRRGNGESPWADVEPRAVLAEHSSGLRWWIDRIQFRTQARQGRDELWVFFEGDCGGGWFFLPE